MLMWTFCCAGSRYASTSNGGAEEGERAESDSDGTDSDSNHRWSMIEQRLSRLEAATQQLKADTQRLKAHTQRLQAATQRLEADTQAVMSQVYKLDKELRRQARMMRWHDTVLHGGEPASCDSRKMIWPVQEHKCTSNFCT